MKKNQPIVDSPFFTHLDPSLCEMRYREISYTCTEYTCLESQAARDEFGTGKRDNTVETSESEL